MQNRKDIIHICVPGCVQLSIGNVKTFRNWLFIVFCIEYKSFECLLCCYFLHNYITGDYSTHIIF